MVVSTERISASDDAQRAAKGRPTRKTIAEHIDPTANSLNFVRLLLAATVIVWHAFVLSGRSTDWPYGVQLVSDVPVDGFFAISGFLLAGSWLHSPNLLRYLRNRFLRLMPAFFTCLILVAFVIAPITALIQQGSAASVFSGPHSAWQYVLHDSNLSMDFYDVGGTPRGVPVPGVWDGSLWTLYWEATAYLALAILGVAAILRRRWATAVIFALVWLMALALALGLLPDEYRIRSVSRLGLMFLAGALIQLYGDKIPARRGLFAVALALLAAGALLPNYRLIAAPALAYSVIWIGGRLTAPALQLKDRDISYGLYIYAMPFQQILLMLGAARLPLAIFVVASLAITVPVAMASWFYIERPMLRLKASSWRSESSIGLRHFRTPHLAKR
ncbi:acyltransferase [Microbacterium sp. STN6]|uniref:acyltransferase family protein n=1 Tax=Microbacterium sp. STN6 TaxID=2995588 RepID=UPI002260F597|nr:acyltransferase [Microbacterium sp. STN6]MCX7523026.1 acyltransferase [Microbacterium sp. STN6]